MFLSGSSKRGSTPQGRTSQDPWVNTAQWPPPGKTRVTTGSADIQGSSDKMKYWIGCTVHPETAEDETKDKVTRSTGFKVQLGDEAGAKIRAQGRGQQLHGWVWLGQLGIVSALRTHAGQQKKMYAEMGQGELSTLWESSFRELIFLQAKMK